MVKTNNEKLYFFDSEVFESKNQNLAKSKKLVDY